jgi:hypothetical protein
MKPSLLFLMLIVFSSIAFAQVELDEDTPPKFRDRVYFGGGFGLNSGTINGVGYFSLAINPVIGYMVTPRLSAGTGLSWQRTTFDKGVNTTLNQYGVSPFVRYNFNQLFAYSEYNYFSTSTMNSPDRMGFNRMLLGMGYTQPLGKRGAINVVGMYDVLYNPNDAVFGSPWVYRVFFSF